MIGAMDVRSIVAEIAVRTPALPLGDRIWVKLENLQPIGSFKIRGAYYAMRTLRPSAVLTASAGNMAQGVAFAARDLGGFARSGHESPGTSSPAATSKRSSAKF